MKNTTIHPKVAGASLGASLGLVIVAALDSVHGVHLAPEFPGAITAFLSVLGGWLAPNGLPPVP